MPVANATISQTATDESGNFNARSRQMTESNNPKIDYLDPNAFRKPDYFVYIYSVVDQRPAGKHLSRSLPPLISHLDIAEIAPGERYRLVTKLAHPTNQHYLDVNDQPRTDFHDAKRLAMDIVNPGNPSMDQNAEINPVNTFSQGNDYGKLGVFWSLNFPPTDEEVAAAIKRKEDFYRSRLEQARILEATDPKALNAFIKTEDHCAADYFGEEYTWHRTVKRPAFCPNCGESIREGVAYHRNVDGIFCIIDWKRAVEAGIKTMKQVPESKRWDTAPVSAEQEFGE